MDTEYNQSAAGFSSQLSDALVARLAGLEMRNATLRRVNVILLFGMVAALAASLLALGASGFFSGGERTFVGRSVMLHDADGVTRGTWRVGEDGATMLQLNDRNSVPRVKLSVLETGDPGVALTDARGRTRIVLGLLPDQGGTLAFADDQGNTRVVLGVGPDESTTLVFVDAQGETRAGLGVSGAGDATLTLYQREGQAPATSPGAAVDTTATGGAGDDVP